KPASNRHFSCRAPNAHARRLRPQYLSCIELVLPRLHYRACESPTSAYYITGDISFDRSYIGQYIGARRVFELPAVELQSCALPASVLDALSKPTECRNHECDESDQQGQRTREAELHSVFA